MTAMSPSYQPMPAPTNFYVCRLCGSAPAAKVTFRGHRGMLILMRFVSVEGPFCHNCGLAAFRDETAKTMLLGWWGWISLFVTPIVLLINAARVGKVSQLGPPQRVPGAPATIPAPLDPGSPLIARPPFIIGLVIILAVVGCVAGLIVTS